MTRRSAPMPLLGGVLHRFCVQCLSCTVGWQFAIVEEDAANLMIASGDVGCGFTLASITSVLRQLIFKFMILHRALGSMSYLIWKFNFGVYRIRRFLKWLAFVTETGCAASA
eukprot:gnl/MRDRNA2_/MRDRNA2_71576_c0_seq1.p1 gnl/MRDRNA2_/MRDRNA2_71576_c0~~gnl/MRDRNA2_/MRDRNA2_71576_c0_seq1.p1  ORF type:complete len:112 (+),score=10.86 gnl/MRDRNA2_/MRDRNA2_71576_c0_seq1:381-716(+)